MTYIKEKYCRTDLHNLENTCFQCQCKRQKILLFSSTRTLWTHTYEREVRQKTFVKKTNILYLLMRDFHTCTHARYTYIKKIYIYTHLLYINSWKNWSFFFQYKFVDDKFSYFTMQQNYKSYRVRASELVMHEEVSKSIALYASYI